MAWRKYRLVPRLALASLGAPRDQARAWNRFWSGVHRTGADGDVLYGLPVRPGEEQQRIPSYFAVLRLVAPS
jgi:hypothetical protein